MMNNILKGCFIIISLFISVTLFAQGKQANIWYFGLHAGLDFNGQNPPQVLNDGETWVNEGGYAAISDNNGNLLFYSDGEIIWNRDHNIMLNGADMGIRATQGAMIIPFINDTNLFYFFNHAHYIDEYHFKFQYSVIDMRLDNGLGGVLTDQKGIPLLYNSTFCLAAVRHRNQRDIWLVTHGMNDNRYFSFLITPNSLQTQPHESTAGSYCYIQGGYAKISSNGKKIGIAQYNGSDEFFEMLNFHDDTGFVTDEDPVRKDRGSFGIEFSPDNTRLYVNSTGSIYQYDISLSSAQDILNSEINITPQSTAFAALQLGPDGKIYCSAQSEYVGVISNPNIYGPGCNYDPEGIFLNQGYYSFQGLPSFIQSYLRDPEFNTTLHCSGQATLFNIININGIDSVHWKFNDFANAPNDTSSLFNPSYTFSGPGTFFPQLTVWSGSMQKSVTDTVIIYQTPQPYLGPDTAFCANETINLPLDAGPGQTYSWNNAFPPTGDSTYLVTGPGVYTVKVTDHGCVGRDTITVTRYPEPTVMTEPVISPSNCGQSNGTVTGLQVSAPDLFVITWLDASGNELTTGNNLLYVPAGNYFARVGYGSNCSFQFGPYSIPDNNAPVIASALPVDDDHCSQGLGSITVTPESGNISDYMYSLNGTDYFPLTAEITGLTGGVAYYITLRDQFGCISASAQVEVQNLPGPAINCIPTPETGSNSNGTITVIPSGINLTYQLEGGSIQLENLFTGLAADTYYVIVTDEFGCSTSDTVIVDNLQGSLLVALADNDRKCLYKPAESEIRIALVTGMKDMQATLYFNSNLLHCTNFNANNADFPGITAHIFNTPARVELAWHGISPVSSADTLSMGRMIFETLQSGSDYVNWEANSTITYFLNESGDTINPVFFPGVILIHDIPEIIVNTEQSVCEHDSITLVPQINGGTDPFEYLWFTPKGTNPSQEVNVINAGFADSGNYKLTISDHFNCADTVQVNLTVIPQPSANFPDDNGTIAFEGTYLLEANPGYASYEWNTGDTTYFIEVNTEGEYSVTMKTEEGCQATESVYMLDTFVPVRVPNAFTPNGDGLNDIFKPVVNPELVKQFSMSIYNKWGQRIFETTSAGKGWDGMNALAGVYVWVIIYENRVGKMFEVKGWVSLVR